jgi:hypothetical protein
LGYPATMTVAIRDLVDRAVAAHRSLADLGEAVEDEWSYVNDLHAAWSERLAAVATVRGEEPASILAQTAVERAIGELGMITDPHRAIDWLSTFPQVVLLAVGEPA